MIGILAYGSLITDPGWEIERRRDSTLLEAGVETRLSRLYEAAILEMAGDAGDLAEARLRIAKKKGIL